MEVLDDHKKIDDEPPSIFTCSTENETPKKLVFSLMCVSAFICLSVSLSAWPLQSTVGQIFPQIRDKGYLL